MEKEKFEKASLLNKQILVTEHVIPMLQSDNFELCICNGDAKIKIKELLRPQLYEKLLTIVRLEIEKDFENAVKEFNEL